MYVLAVYYLSIVLQKKRYVCVSGTIIVVCQMKLSQMLYSTKFNTFFIINPSSQNESVMLFHFFTCGWENQNKTRNN